MINWEIIKKLHDGKLTNCPPQKYQNGKMSKDEMIRTFSMHRRDQKSEYDFIHTNLMEVATP